MDIFFLCVSLLCRSHSPRWVVIIIRVFACFASFSFLGPFIHMFLFIFLLDDYVLRFSLYLLNESKGNPAASCSHVTLGCPKAICLFGFLGHHRLRTTTQYKPMCPNASQSIIGSRLGSTSTIRHTVIFIIINFSFPSQCLTFIQKQNGSGGYFRDNGYSLEILDKHVYHQKMVKVTCLLYFGIHLGGKKKKKCKK